MDPFAIGYQSGNRGDGGGVCSHEATGRGCLMTGFPPTTNRNWQNARASTGPRREGGKAMARRTAVRHGLTANPAAGVVEHPGCFTALQQQLEDALKPRNTIEGELAHRIAVALWRLQRAAAGLGSERGAHGRARAPPPARGEISRRSR